jgi:hypothetical protein
MEQTETRFRKMKYIPTVNHTAGMESGHTLSIKENNRPYPATGRLNRRQFANIPDDAVPDPPLTMQINC